MQTSSAIKAIAQIMQEFRAIEPDLPASYAAIILYVARHEKLKKKSPSIREISDALGMTGPSVSRATLALSTHRRGATRAAGERPTGARKALGVLERVPDDHDLRMMRCSLSAKGKGVISRLVDVIADLNET